MSIYTNLCQLKYHRNISHPGASNCSYILTERVKITFNSLNTKQKAYHLFWTLPNKLLVCNNICMHIHMINNGHLQEKRKMATLISQKGINQA